MKNLLPTHPGVSLLYVVYQERSEEPATAGMSPFYVWGKRTLSFFKRPRKSAPRGY